MPIQTTCPDCGRTLRVPDALIGERVKCPSCLTQFTVEDERPGTPDPGYRAEPEKVPVGAPTAKRYSDYAADADEWDDDDDFRPRRGRHRMTREEAGNKLLGPAIGLLVAGILGLLLGLFLIVLAPFMLEEAQDPEEKRDAIQALVAAPVQLIASVIVIVGAIAMLRVRRHSLATTGTVVALVPCMSPCCILGIPFGIWGMMVLNNNDVKRAFGQRASFSGGHEVE